MNAINPDDLHESRQSGNDTLTALETMDADELTAARASLAANELRTEAAVKDAEAVIVDHRGGVEQWMQVNVYIDTNTVRRHLIAEWEDGYDLRFLAPHAAEDELVLLFRVPEVEVNKAKEGLGDLFG